MKPADRIAAAEHAIASNAAALERATYIGWAWAVDLFTRARRDLLEALAVDLADIATVCTRCGRILALAEDGPAAPPPVD